MPKPAKAQPEKNAEAGALRAALWPRLKTIAVLSARLLVYVLVKAARLPLILWRGVEALYEFIVKVVICAIILAGAVPIIILQWREAADKTGFGTSHYGQGVVGTTLLTCVLAGIAIMVWAVPAYAFLSWLLLGRRDYGQVLPPALPMAEQQKPQNVPVQNNIID